MESGDRRTVLAGPFRFRFLREGRGVSIDESGLRLGSGPRAFYVSALREGLNYRATPDRAGGGGGPLRPATFADCLAEINRCQAQISLSRLFGRALAVLGLSATIMVGMEALLLTALALPGWAIGRWLDSYRRAVVVFYDLEEPVTRAYRAVIDRFEDLSDCAGKWRIALADRANGLRTRGSEQGPVVRRDPVLLDRMLPAVVRSNLVPPVFHMGTKRIYLFPDVVLVELVGQIGAVGYGDLQMALYDASVVETGRIPGDAQRTAEAAPPEGGSREQSTWRYDVMLLRDADSLDELIEFSRTGVVLPFFGAIENLPKQRAGA